MARPLNINYIDYSIATKSLDIFFAGCWNNCHDCCNPELMDFNNGTDFVEWLPKIENYLVNYESLIERVFLVGGSPNHQDPEQMEAFLAGLRRRCHGDIKIFAFCGEDIIDQVQPVLKKYCDYVKVGAYMPELLCDDNIQYGIKLATSNQQILKKGEDY